MPWSADAMGYDNKLLLFLLELLNTPNHDHIIKWTTRPRVFELVNRAEVGLGSP